MRSLFQLNFITSGDLIVTHEGADVESIYAQITIYAPEAQLSTGLLSSQNPDTGAIIACSHSSCKTLNPFESGEPWVDTAGDPVRKYS